MVVKDDQPWYQWEWQGCHYLDKASRQNLYPRIKWKTKEVDVSVIDPWLHSTSSIFAKIPWSTSLLDCDVWLEKSIRNFQWIFIVEQKKQLRCWTKYSLLLCLRACKLYNLTNIVRSVWVFGRFDWFWLPPKAWICCILTVRRLSLLQASHSLKAYIYAAYSSRLQVKLFVSSISISQILSFLSASWTDYSSLRRLFLCKDAKKCWIVQYLSWSKTSRGRLKLDSGWWTPYIFWRFLCDLAVFRTKDQDRASLAFHWIGSLTKLSLWCLSYGL